MIASWTTPQNITKADVEAMSATQLMDSLIEQNQLACIWFSRHQKLAVQRSAASGEIKTLVKPTPPDSPLSWTSRRLLQVAIRFLRRK
jgi:hypothetical protein